MAVGVTEEEEMQRDRREASLLRRHQRRGYVGRAVQAEEGGWGQGSEAGPVDAFPMGDRARASWLAEVMPRVSDVSPVEPDGGSREGTTPTSSLAQWVGMCHLSPWGDPL